MNSFILSIVGGVISIGIGWFDKNFLSGTQGKDDKKMTTSLILRYFLMGFGVSYIVLLGSSYMMGEGEVQGNSMIINDMEDITDSLLENTRETFSVGRPRF